MSQGIECLLRACRIRDLGQVLSSLAAAWGEMCQLSICEVEPVGGPLPFGSKGIVSAKWCRESGACIVHWRRTGEEGSSSTQPGNSVSLDHDGVLVACVSGQPADQLHGATDELRSASAWLIAQAFQFQDELTRQKLEAMAEYAAGAAHEINNPLATIIGRTKQLLAGEMDPERRRWLETIGAQAYRIRDMIGDTMLFGRPPTPQPQRVDLTEQVRTVTGKFAEEFHRRRISLFCKSGRKDDRVGEPVVIQADPVQLSVVISELVRNALEAVPDNAGKICIELQSEQSEGRRWGAMRVSDNGPGLSEEAREHLFDPFFSGRQAGRGLGFGLSKCWRIVQLHGGSIGVSASADGGLEILVRWPSADVDR